MTIENYKPVAVSSAALARIVNIMGIELPPEVHKHFDVYNFGNIDGIKILGVSGTISDSSNLCLSLAEYRKFKDFPSALLPLFIDKEGNIVGYDVAYKKCVKYDNEKHTSENLECELTGLFEYVSNPPQTASLEDCNISDIQLMSIVRFIRNEINDSREDMISLAMAYSLEPNSLNNGRHQQYYVDYLYPRVVKILTKTSEMAIFNLKETLQKTSQLYQLRCNAVTSLKGLSDIIAAADTFEYIEKPGNLEKINKLTEIFKNVQI